MLRIIPAPKLIEEKSGTVSLCGVRVLIQEGAGRGVALALASLCEEIEKITGEYVPLYVLSGKGPFEGAITVSCGNGGEGYSLTVSERGAEIVGEGDAGAFYGIQSLRQLVAENGAELPLCHIEDRPDFSYRGFYHDVTRGRVPTLKKLKEIADTLAYYKINSLQLYVEDAFTFKELEGTATPECALTPSEILELDAYCRERYIDLIPSMATFGHLYTLLQSSKYRHICELCDYEPKRSYWLEKQWHHTVDVYNPETVKVIESMINQYVPLFSSKYFNICCDETIDLCNGKNSGKDKGEAYFHHLEKLVKIVSSHGKTVMLWGDECMARPDEAKARLPEDAVVLNWCYRPKVAEWIPKMFWERGFKQIACTGTSCWESFVENINISVGNISSYAAHAKKYGAMGILNTNWGDFGHVCPFNCNLYGLMFGAEKSWNAESESDEVLEMAASLLLYGVREHNMADTLRALGRAAMTCSWTELVLWHSAVTLEGKARPLGYGMSRNGPNTAEDARRSAEICRKEIERLSGLGGGQKTEDIILSAKAIELMNRAAVYFNGDGEEGEKAALQGELELWLSEYSKSWLRDDKPSGLGRICDFVEHLMEAPIIRSNEHQGEIH
ncbi:MAG: beta-N-acetylhexosaminidase [Clostridia bacterium]|nr:beta-N-acetylhexosaminidase [Clostridia bacterium]